MIRYFATKENANNFAQNKQNLYGICACVIGNGLVEIIRYTGGISDNSTCIKAIADKLNQNDVEPIHLNDIIEDELYHIRV